MMMALGLAWLGAGIYSIVSWYRFRDYVNGLQPTPGNRAFQAVHRRGLVYGIIFLILGFWRVGVFFNQWP